MGFLSVLGCRPLGYFCWCFPLPPDGRIPTGAVCRSRVPARSLLARGGPRPLLRFPRSLRSRPATAVGALGERCPASRCFFFGYRRGGSLAGCRYAPRPAQVAFGIGGRALFIPACRAFAGGLWRYRATVPLLQHRSQGSALKAAGWSASLRRSPLAPAHPLNLRFALVSGMRSRFWGTPFALPVRRGWRF